MTREEFIRHVEATQKSLRRFLVALCCGDSQRADDIAQETYLKAYLSLDNYRGSSAFSSWLYRIGYNVFLNQCRSVKRFDTYKEAEEFTANERADSSFCYESLYKALNELSPSERVSILLYYMQGYSIKEVAEIEKVSEDAVKKHLSRGRRHLRGLLGKDK